MTLAGRLEPAPLFVEQRRLGLVGGAEVRVHGVEPQVRAGEQLRQRARQVVVTEAEPVEAGVDLEVIGERRAARAAPRLPSARPAAGLEIVGVRS